MAKSVVSQAIADACFLILVGKTGMKNKDFTREKQNRRKRVKCQTD
jgi:hypothetical protein